MTETRKLAAILAADVVGYSRIAGADEGRILARLRALRSDLIDHTIAVHNGRIVKRTGTRSSRGALGRTGACAQAGDLPTGTNQTRFHTEGQRQAQAAGHLNLAGSGLHDSSDAGAGADLRSRPSTGAIRLPCRAKRPT